MRKLGLHWKILIGLGMGVVWAVISSIAGWSQFTINWINPWGDIFIRLLKMIAVPLVLFSIIKGISGLNISKLGRIGLKTISFYIITTIMAVSLGLLLVNIIQPGTRMAEHNKKQLQANIAQYASQVDVNHKIEVKKNDASQWQGQGPLTPIVNLFPDNIFSAFSDNLKMLQIIFFAILFGIALSLIPEKEAKPLTDFVDAVNAVILKLVDIIMKGAPFFVFALLAGQIAKLAGDNPSLMMSIFGGLLWYSLTVLIGLGILVFAFYPAIIKILVRKISYKNFFKSISDAQILAFSTSSSAATLPVTMDCARDHLGVSEEISAFVLPIGATVNMDGTSLYQAVAAVFLAQFYGYDLSLFQQLTIVITATLASIGAPAIPSAGLVMLIIVLESVGLPATWIALIFPVDRILDMCRTVVNVTGDTTAATVIANSENELSFHADQFNKTKT